MIEESTREEIEAEYGMPVGRLMYHFYHEKEMSAGEIADELGEARSTVKYWLQHSGIKMRSRTLTDVQRILIIAYLNAGLGNAAISSKADCGKMSVYRYRKEVESAGQPVDIEQDLSPTEFELLCDLIGETAVDESTSNCATDSEQEESNLC